MDPFSSTLKANERPVPFVHEIREVIRTLERKVEEVGKKVFNDTNCVAKTQEELTNITNKLHAYDALLPKAVQSIYDQINGIIADPKEANTLISSVLQELKNLEEVVCPISLEILQVYPEPDCEDLIGFFERKYNTLPEFSFEMRIDQTRMKFVGKGINGKGELVAAGSYGRVFFNSENGLALKICGPRIKKEDGKIITKLTPREDLENESAILLRMEKIGNPHVIGAIKVEFIGSMLFILMREVKGKQLGEILPQITTAKSKITILLEMVKALEAIHAQGIIHRDIKPENIIVNPENLDVFIVDFGIARPEGCKEPSGSLAYMPPETIRKKEQNVKSDICSFGIVMYEVITRKRLRSDDNWRLLISKSVKIPLSTFENSMPGLTKEIYEKLVKNINACLLMNVDQRPSSAQLVKVFEEVLRDIIFLEESG